MDMIAIKVERPGSGKNLQWRIATHHSFITYSDSQSQLKKNRNLGINNNSCLIAATL